MASRQRRPHSSDDFRRHERGIMRPIISSDIMGNRNVEIVPVGAWVEPADDDFQPDSVRAAKFEEEKICKLQNEKENKLRNFQKQTKHRVTKANTIKRQQQILEAEKAFEIERKVVQQSSLTGILQRKDTCVVRPDLDLAIRKRLLDKYGEDVDTWGNDIVPAIQSHTEESHQVSGKARQQLISKKIAQNHSEDNIRNDWRKKTTSYIHIPVSNVIDVQDHPPSACCKNSNNYGNIGTCDYDVASDTKEHLTQSLLPKSKLSDNEKVEDVCKGENGKVNNRQGDKPKLHYAHQVVTSQLKKKKRSESSKRPKSAQLAAILFRDSESDIRARQLRHQAAISRKVFMDREREAVRESIRRQEHKRKIKILKAEKEIYRQELEELAQKKLEPTESSTRESNDEIKLREKMEALYMEDMIDQQRNEIRKAKETKRYVSALRHTVMEKANRQGIQLPSLCACGQTVWDTHPDTCANNCFFYKNYRAYARALQSLLLSTDVS